ncbi:MAG: hypothetical protein NC548_25715 [Lachnospiraceae bacterium]|nr:hypothetical protein [Lachnospiraceae bacterium]
MAELERKKQKTEIEDKWENAYSHVAEDLQLDTNAYGNDISTEINFKIQDLSAKVQNGQKVLEGELKKWKDFGDRWNKEGPNPELWLEIH